MRFLLLALLLALSFQIICGHLFSMKARAQAKKLGLKLVRRNGALAYCYPNDLSDFQVWAPSPCTAEDLEEVVGVEGEKEGEETKVPCEKDEDCEEGEKCLDEATYKQEMYTCVDATEPECEVEGHWSQRECLDSAAGIPQYCDVDTDEEKHECKEKPSCETNDDCDATEGFGPCKGLDELDEDAPMFCEKQIKCDMKNESKDCSTGYECVSIEELEEEAKEVKFRGIRARVTALDGPGKKEEVEEGEGWCVSLIERAKADVGSDGEEVEVPTKKAAAAVDAAVPLAAVSGYHAPVQGIGGGGGGGGGQNSRPTKPPRIPKVKARGGLLKKLGEKRRRDKMKPKWSSSTNVSRDKDGKYAFIEKDSSVASRQKHLKH